MHIILSLSWSQGLLFTLKIKAVASQVQTIGADWSLFTPPQATEDCEDRKRCLLIWQLQLEVRAYGQMSGPLCTVQLVQLYPVEIHIAVQ